MVHTLSSNFPAQRSKLSKNNKKTCTEYEKNIDN